MNYQKYAKPLRFMLWFFPITLGANLGLTIAFALLTIWLEGSSEHFIIIWGKVTSIPDLAQIPAMFCSLFIGFFIAKRKVYPNTRIM